MGSGRIPPRKEKIPNDIRNTCSVELQHPIQFIRTSLINKIVWQPVEFHRDVGEPLFAYRFEYSGAESALNHVVFNGYDSINSMHQQAEELIVNRLHEAHVDDFSFDPLSSEDLGSSQGV